MLVLGEGRGMCKVEDLIVVYQGQFAYKSTIPAGRGITKSREGLVWMGIGEWGWGWKGKRGRSEACTRKQRQDKHSCTGIIIRHIRISITTH